MADKLRKRKGCRPDRDKFLVRVTGDFPGAKRMWRNTFLALSLTLLLANTAYSVNRKLIKVETIPGTVKYKAVGLVPFPPEVISSTANLRIINALSNREVPSFIIEESRWPDNSLMLVKIGFVVESEGWQTQQYWLEWGKEISRSSARARELPETTFHLVEGLPDEAEDIINVGTMIIKVEQQAAVRYYWHLVPITVLLSIVIWRKVRLT